jgi:hypothetical protein
MISEPEHPNTVHECEFIEEDNKILAAKNKIYRKCKDAEKTNDMLHEAGLK